MTDQQVLDERLTIVTGAASGIGARVARRLTADGYTVLACDRDAAVSETVDAINAEVAGGRAEGLIGDIATEATLEAARHVVERHGGALSALINNAAVIPLRRVDEATPDDFDDAMSVNVKSAWRWTISLRDQLAASGCGAVVNIASTHPWQTKVASFPYNVSKGAVLALTKALAVDLGPIGIRVNSVLPGICATAPTLTWIATHPDPDAKALDLVDDHPLRRLPTTDEVANAVAFLCSNAASGITGTELVVDCGRQAQRR